RPGSGAQRRPVFPVPIAPDGGRQEPRIVTVNSGARHRDGSRAPSTSRPARVPRTFPLQEANSMARKTIRVSDMSGNEIPEGKGATVRITFADARKGSRELDLTDAEAEKLGGRSVGRRGRKPKVTT